MHDLLMLITQYMPMKTIEINGEAYLERYFVGVDENGNQNWLHRFLRDDNERHVHSHPWYADSTILCGKYLEERFLHGARVGIEYRAGARNSIFPSTLHRIIEVDPNTWTHMRVYAGREPTWYFIDDAGNKTEMQTSPVEWWKDCKCRGAV